MGFSGHMITVFLYRDSCCSAFTITSSDYSNCCNIKPLLSHYTFGHIADTKLISIRTVDSNREKKFYLTVLYSFSSPSLSLSLPPYPPPIPTQSSTPTPPPFPLLTLRPTHTLPLHPPSSHPSWRTTGDLDGCHFGLLDNGSVGTDRPSATLRQAGDDPARGASCLGTDHTGALVLGRRGAGLELVEGEAKEGR